MPKAPPRRELAATGRTMADAWEDWTHAERVAHIRSGEFEIRLNGRGKTGFAPS